MKLDKLFALFFTVFLALGLCGCIAVMSFVAESSKAKQALNVSYSQALEIVKVVIKEQGITFQEAVIKENITEVKGRYGDELTVHIFIHKISSTQCHVAVRVGISEAGKKEAEKILKAIVEYSQMKQISLTNGT